LQPQEREGSSLANIRKALLERLRVGIAHGELDKDTAVELLTAPILKAILLSEPDQPVPCRLIERVVDQPLRGGRPPEIGVKEANSSAHAPDLPRPA